MRDTFLIRMLTDKESIYFISALLHNSEIRFLMIGLCFHITNFESIFHRLELNVAYNYEKIELCNKELHQ